MSIIWTLIGLVAAFTVGVVIVSVVVGIRLTRKPRLPISTTPDRYGLNYRSFETTSRDGTTNLRGWVMEPEHAAKMTVIFAHGYGESRLQENINFLSLSTFFVARHYRVVLFDFRGCGESDGNETTIGVLEKLDVLGVIDYVRKVYAEPIGLYGVSMGASASLLAAAEDGNIHAIVADSPFSDLRTYLSDHLSVWTKLPRLPFTPIMMRMIPWITGVKPREANPYEALQRLSHTPILFIHGRGDDAIPFAESERLAAIDPQRFQLWGTDSRRHVRSHVEQPMTYRKRLLDFLDASLAQQVSATSLAPDDDEEKKHGKAQKSCPF
ncbi:alpha/beta hydrolase [Marinicrinis sediminis]|uniref:Alpha/beta hydrolase n=1 Tax=Marinicrinis sediminis TaxID=1652465 RepID=A0ABW5RD04_9BACL